MSFVLFLEHSENAIKKLIAPGRREDWGEAGSLVALCSSPKHFFPPDGR
jgi:hypothetical protein